MVIKSAVLEASAPTASAIPAAAVPEFAFIGRSNVGKSSLINMLAGRHDLAHVSATPGKTRLLNFYRINNNWRLVDLPGYGFAKVAKDKRADFNVAVADYLEHGPNLSCVFVLIDACLPPQRIDIEFIRWLDSRDVPYVLVFTKADKISRGRLPATVAAMERELATAGVPAPESFAASAKTRDGRDALLGFISAEITGKND
jgi:GTP-binding protein